MADRIEEVKKILKEMEFTTHGLVLVEGTGLVAKLTDSDIEQICQLFEPKPNEGRLLTEELREIWLQWQESGENYGQLIDAVSTKTASIKDAECKEIVAAKSIIFAQASEALIAFVEWLRDEEAVAQGDWDLHCKAKWDAILKATHLKGDEVKRNTKADPELGQE